MLHIAIVNVIKVLTDITTNLQFRRNFVTHTGVSLGGIYLSRF